ncbi:STAS domain-containing protein [Streptomyces microflavus]|uniref:STAS domain-containing protein n=1 Tax=Streptomyces TaxID=1883 RepID=UPI001E64DEA3|nr:MULTISPECIES: STAS domain-containing protein [Streptomyces]MDX2982197.1 STAS domain-containing protein [Streptomyces sp. NRRL_B-2249]
MTTHQPVPDSSAPGPVLSPVGEFDMDNVPALLAEIETVIAVHGGVVLDASGITFADSSFLRMILGVHQRTDLRIVAPSSRVARLFDIAGVDTYLRVYPTLDAARVS